MPRSPSIAFQCAILLGSAILLLTLVSDTMAASRLKRSDFYRYRSLAAGYVSAIQDSAPQLQYPDGMILTENNLVDLRRGRLMSAARSLLNVEDILIREWNRNSQFTTDQSLTTARSYRDVGEFGEALKWYRRALHRGQVDDPGSAELRREMFSTAVLSADSLQVTEEFLNLMGLADLRKVESTLELAFRWMIVEDHGRNLDHLMAKVVGQIDGLGPRIRFWYSYVLAMRSDRGACLDHLLRLMAEPGVSGQLEPQQLGWVLRTIPDILYLEQGRDDALRLYHTLEELPGETGAWARYQLANGYFLAGDYTAARQLYGEFCNDQTQTSWRARACDMAAMVDQLASIQQEGVPYGTDSIHTR